MNLAANRGQQPMSEATVLASEYTAATGVTCAVLDSTGELVYPAKLREYPCWFCRLAHGNVPSTKQVGEEHLTRAKQALRFGGRQVFLCPSSLLHWAIPVTDEEERFLGALIGGPVRTIDEESFFVEEILKPMELRSREVARAEVASLKAMFDKVPLVDSHRVHALTEQLFRASSSLQYAGAGMGKRRSERLLRESRINEYIQELKRYRNEEGLDPERPSYPLDKEQRLLDTIGAGDVEGAQAALNELLGHVFFTLGADLERIKNRAREIVVLLSRIAISNGGDTERVFGLNYQFLDELPDLEDINEIAHWMARIVRRFASSILTVPGSAVHVTALRRALDYVHRSYRGRVTLAQAAAAAGLSAPYMSQVFSKEMGEPFTRYVQRVRLSRMRELLGSTSLTLSDIAELCGFSDQSHMTKLSRRLLGRTPAEIRRSSYGGPAP